MTAQQDRPDRPAVPAARFEITLRDDTRSPVRGHGPVPWRAVLHLVPAAVLVGTVTILPLVWTVGISFQHGLRDYAAVLQDAQVRHAIVDSLWWLLLAFAVCGVGLLIAWRTRGIRRLGVLAAPIAVSALVTAVAFRLIFEPGGTTEALTGWNLLGRRGIWIVIGLAFVWQWAGLAVLVFRAGLNGVPRSLMRMARAFGVGPWRRFTSVVFPALRTGGALVLVTALVAAARAFELVLVTAPGSEQSDVDVLGVHWWRWQNDLSRGASAALTVLLFLLVAGVAVLGLWRLNREWPHVFGDAPAAGPDGGGGAGPGPAGVETDAVSRTAGAGSAASAPVGSGAVGPGSIASVAAAPADASGTGVTARIAPRDTAPAATGGPDAAGARRASGTGASSGASSGAARRIRTDRGAGDGGPSRSGRVVAAVTVALWAFPLLVLVLTSLHTPRAAAGGGWWDAGFGLDSYRRAFATGELGGALLGTGARSLLAAVLLLIVAVPAAYALAWEGLSQRAGTTLIAAATVLAAVPPQTVIVELGDVFQRLHLLGAPTALTLVHTAFGVPFAVLLLRSAFAVARPELLRLRRLDPDPGSEIVAVMRESRHAVLTVAVLEFVLVWNDFLVGLLLGGPEAGQVTFVLYDQVRQFTTSAGVLAAGAVVATAVPLTLVLVTGPTLVKGFTQGVRR